MNVYIYAADIYCEDCGRAIRKRIKQEGHAPANPKDEYTYDSDQYPKGPYDDGGGEADHPQHCGSGPKCINAMTLTDGTKVGMFLANPLTTDGYRYVREQHNESRSEVTTFWMDYYGLKPDEDDDDDTDD